MLIKKTGNDIIKMKRCLRVMKNLFLGHLMIPIKINKENKDLLNAARKHT